MVTRWLISALLIAGCARKDVRQELSKPTSATLFVSGDLRGYLAPCGCSENMRGGIARAAFQVAEARKSGTPVLYVDAGNSLFSQPQLPEVSVQQEERKAQALAEVFTLMGLSTQAVGERDEARGPEFRRALRLPFQEGEQLRLLDAGGHRVAVVTARSGEVLATLSAQARKEGAAFVLGLLQQPLEVAQQAGALPGLQADLIVAARADDELSGEDNKLLRGTVPVVQLQSKGRSLLKLDLSFSGLPGQRFSLLRGQADVERELAAHDARIELLRKQVNEPSLKPELKTLRQQKLEEVVGRRKSLASSALPAPPDHNGFFLHFVPLESSFPSLPEAQAAVAAYDRDVGQLNLKWAQQHGRDCPSPAEGQAGFVGNQGCQGCHPAEYGVWSTSQHAHAYRTLEEVGKNFHLDCVGCHLTGYQRPGGVCRIDQVEALKNVGCESCHGPGSLHVKKPVAGTIHRGNRPEDCLGCHNKENSPHFEFSRYLAEIVAPGHGRPLATEERAGTKN